MDPEQAVKQPDNTTTCKNCGHLYSGNFCNECGQQADTRRFDLKTILHELLHAVTHVEKGHLYSFKNMITRPGHTIREYLEGKRVEHSNPLVILLIIATLSSFLYDKYEVATLNSIKLHEIQDNLHLIASKFFAFASLIYSILFAACDYLFFRYKKYYYAELYLFNIFQMVEVLVLNLLLLPLWIALGDTPACDYARIAVYLLIIAYFIFVRYQFFEVGGDKKARTRLITEAMAFLIILFFIGWKTISHIIQA